MFALSIVLFPSETLNSVGDNNIKPCIFVGGSSVDADAQENEVDVNGDALRDVAEKGTGEDSSDGDDPPTDSPLPLPASLGRATRVGATIREVRNPQEATGEEEEELEEDEASIVFNNEDKQHEDVVVTSPNANSAEDIPRNPKPPLTGCHWGTTGCRKWSATGGEGVNSSSTETSSDDVLMKGNAGDRGTKSAPSSSSLAGSATAKIEARVMKARGGSSLSQPPVWDRDNAEYSKEAHRGPIGHSPPQGFKLAGRVVTSPSDGLSYFLDAPQVDPEDNNGDWMMTIPYAYLDCGPTIESTTEAFSLAEMVLRHFPASASIGHWTNLGGGVTIDDGERGGPKYIDTDGDVAEYPKLLVALSPIEITVSGNGEESRVFSPGDVILLEDTLGKGHKLQPLKKPDAPGQDMSVLMLTLPHAVHFPLSDEWLEDSYLDEVDEDNVLSESSDSEIQSSAPSASWESQPPSYGAEHALFGFAPKHLHQKHRQPMHRNRSSYAANAKKPCPLEYDSAYSSLFMPTNQYMGRHRRSRRDNHRSGESQFTKGSSLDDSYPPPPGYSTYDKHSILFDYLPSLRRTMLVGLGLSLTSSFIYCVQLLYPPLLALWGGATMLLGGALMNVLVTRWSYRRFVADWEEEWRWKREVRKNKMRREEMKMDDDIVIDTLMNAENTETAEGTFDYASAPDETKLAEENEVEDDDETADDTD